VALQRAVGFECAGGEGASTATLLMGLLACIRNIILGEEKAYLSCLYIERSCDCAVEEERYNSDREEVLHTGYVDAI